MTPARDDEGYSGSLVRRFWVAESRKVSLWEMGTQEMVGGKIWLAIWVVEGMDGYRHHTVCNHCMQNFHPLVTTGK
jgi:hypothetical protein